MDTISITESRPGPVLAALHASAGAERDYLYATRPAQPDDLVLVAWRGDRPVGYLAASDEGDGGLLIWEHLVVPHHRNQGIGERLLHEAARRVPVSANLIVDPLAELDGERTSHYYGRLGFRRTRPGAGSELRATAREVVRAVRRRQGDRSETDTPVSVIVNGKASGVVTVKPGTTISQAISLMNRHRVGALVVSSDGCRVEGILSERDVLVGLDEGGAALLSRHAGSVCTTDVLTATMTDPVAAVMDVMTSRHIRHMPVTAQGRLVGIVSVGDFVLHRLYNLDLAYAEPPADTATAGSLVPTGPR